ncbi:MAG: site-specific integrase [Thermomicrobiales bacterium]
MADRTGKSPAKPMTRFAGIDGVTSEERNAPPGSDAVSSDIELGVSPARAHQIELFEHVESTAPEFVTELPALHSEAALPLARSWYRLDLERQQRPANTVHSYAYDLTILEKFAGPKKIDAVSSHDIARYLGDASNKATRKRRLTSARRFFRFLIEQRVLDHDPTEGYFPHHIELRLPVPIFPDEQELLLVTAAEDEPWSLFAFWLMLRLGLTRSEILALRRDHIDRSDEDRPIVYVFHATSTGGVRERSLVSTRAFSDLYQVFLDESGAQDVLVQVGPPAVNSMVERVRTAAHVSKAVTPQVLRHSFAVDQARAGADAPTLLQLLGLSDDPRNRQSVDRYIRLARPLNLTESQ